jgi:hypothetical protein
MEPDFFDSTPEKIDVVLVDETTLSRALRQIVSCENCDDAAEIGAAPRSTPSRRPLAGQPTPFLS